MAEKDKKLRNMGRLSDEQDEAIEECASVLSKRRGTHVAKADVTREALSHFAGMLGVVWPAG